MKSFWFIFILFTSSFASAQDLIDTVEFELDAQFGNSSNLDDAPYEYFKISPDKSHIAVRRGDSIEIWNILTRTLVATISDDLGVFAWHPDGTQIATMTFETELSIWDAFTGEIIQTYNGLDINSNGTRSIEWHLASTITSGSFEYLLWDLDSENLPQIISCHPWGTILSWSPNGEYIATMGNESTLVWICDNEFNQLTSFEGYTTIAWSPFNNEIATVGIFNTLRVWNVISGEVITTSEGGENNILNISWHSQGRKLVTGHLDGEVRIWERLTPDAFWHTGSMRIMGLSQIDWLEDQLITTSSIEGLQIWNVN